MNRKYILLATSAFALSAPLLPATAQAAPPKRAAAISDPTLAKAKQAIGRGIAYLKRTQEADGSWGHYPAFTALATAALLRNGHTELNDPATAKGVQFLLRAAKPNGAIYSDADAAMALPNYNTCLALMALNLTRNPAYKPVIQKAQRFLEQSQFDEGEGIKPNDALYGGIGYGSDPDDHPDLSNLSTALEALKESGEPANAPVFKKALTFIQRVQNRRESNDAAWAKDSPNDGGFVYDSTGESKITPESAHRSMGAMTYAGLKSYLYCGVSKNDPRAQVAWNWIRGHYTVTEHPGMGDTSLYYYYHSMAKTLDVYGQKVVKDNGGKTHRWASDLAGELIARQHPDGSWFSVNKRYLENNPILVTCYCLLSLSYCVKN